MRKLCPGKFQDFNFEILKSRYVCKMSNMPAIYSYTCVLFTGFKVSQPCASVSQLPAALRRPQKKHTPLDFGSMYLAEFVILNNFRGPQALGGCVAAASCASAPSTKTCPWIVGVSCGCCHRLTISGSNECQGQLGQPGTSGDLTLGLHTYTYTHTHTFFILDSQEHVFRKCQEKIRISATGGRVFRGLK